MEYRNNNGYHQQWIHNNWIHSLSGGHQIGAISPPNNGDHFSNNANHHNELYNVQPACIEQNSAKNNGLGIQVRNLEYIYKAKKTGLDNIESLIKPNKKRTTKEILSGVNINIQRGSIYGLLGPSGCGKTTLLRCIVGCLPATKGEIAIFGYKPKTKHSNVPGKQIGYMPQEFALYEDLSIYETLYYFGRIYNLSRSKINRRIKELMTMLDMPEPTRNVARLSGGQRRRVSFAVSLIHNPDLLILDEPTAGVDPLLRERVWVYLLQLCQTRMTTVILTTQYIEETRRAHRVAFMRQGRVIVEQSPDNLLAKYDTQTLEDAFLKICLHEKIMKKKNNSIKVNGNAIMSNAINNAKSNTLTSTLSTVSSKPNAFLNNSTVTNNNNLTTITTANNNSTFSDTIEYGPITYEQRKPFKPPIRTRIKNWLMVFFALMWKNYLTDLRDPLAVCFQFVLPITQVILFSLCIGGSPINIPIGIVNEEALQPGGPDLSTLFIQHINNSLIKIREYDDMEVAWKAAKDLEIWAIVHIRSNFSDATYHKFESPDSEEYYSSYIKNLDSKTLEAFEKPTKHDFQIEEFNPLFNSKITVHADMTNKIVTLTTMRNFFNQYQDFIKDMLRINNWNFKLAKLPIEMQNPIYGKYKEYDYNGFRDFMIPGIMCNITFAIAYTLTAVNLIKERNGQTIERNFVSGVDRTQLLTAHALARFSFMVPYAIVIIYLPVIMFELPALGNLVIVFWLLIMINCTGMTYGMLVSSICATVEMAIILAAGTMFFLMFACGAIWPLESVPTQFKWFAYSTPLALPTEAMRNVLFKGWTIDKTGVWSGFVVCFIYMIIFAYSGLKMFKFNK